MELNWTPFMGPTVQRADGSAGVFVVSGEKVYLMAPDEDVCPINRSRAIRFMETSTPKETAQQWEDEVVYVDDPEKLGDTEGFVAWLESSLKRLEAMGDPT